MTTLLTRKQAANEAGLSVTTLDRDRKKGWLEPVSLKPLRFTSEAFYEWMCLRAAVGDEFQQQLAMLDRARRHEAEAYARELEQDWIPPNRGSLCPDMKRHLLMAEAYRRIGLKNHLNALRRACRDANLPRFE